MQSRNRAIQSRGFTLIEMLVVLVIIVMLASLVLTGLSAAQERSREEQTRSTIAKLHGQVMLLWDSYRTRRVAFNSGGDRQANAAARLLLLRAYQRQEMPDCYADMAATTVAGVAIPLSPLSFHVQSPANAGDQNESAECLFLTVTYGMNADEQVKFNGREIGDTDGDGNQEFIDGWGNPIAWLRWAPGVESEIQHSPLSDFHPDPFDPLGVDRPNPPPGMPPRGYRLFPLIVSAGPDGYFGLYPLDIVGAFPASNDPYDSTYLAFRGAPYLAGAALAEGGSAGDNFHSHDVGVK